MKTDIHPEYKVVTVTCSCGNTFETRSTADELKVELCSQCHPFYTGKQKLVDTGGRIDRFERRFGKRKRPGQPEPEDETPAEQAPAAEAPATETPAAETPAPEAPAAETPAAENTAPDADATDAPAADDAPTHD